PNTNNPKDQPDKDKHSNNTNILNNQPYKDLHSINMNNPNYQSDKDLHKPNKDKQYKQFSSMNNSNDKPNKDKQIFNMKDSNNQLNLNKLIINMNDSNNQLNKDKPSNNMNGSNDQRIKDYDFEPIIIDSLINIIKENKIVSSIQKHIDETKHKMDWKNCKVMCTETSKHKLLIRESLFIIAKKPELNRTTHSVPLYIFPEGVKRHQLPS
ncbi:unnamed protein product, partial [Adineta steineri]